MPVDAVTREAIAAVFRIEWPKLVAGLLRLSRDVAAAEEMAQEAFVAALDRWPQSGIPDRPGAWLMAAARRRAIDELRHQRMAERKHDELVHAQPADASAGEVAARLDEALDDDVGDDLLRLVFAACHPVLPPPSRVALTLRLLGGLTTDEIARAFLTAEATVAQRIVRAKRALAEARVAFEVPRGEERRARLPSVLEVVYLIFNEGYAATAGDHWTRPALCDEATRLGRVLAGLLPDEPEVHGLSALLQLQASRLGARTDAAGAPILLPDQDRGRWDRLLIQRGLAALARAEALADSAGPYALQAAIAACHARARTAEETDWRRIAALYGALAIAQPSPVVELNRAVAVARAEGPEAGLAIVDALGGEAALAGYHLLPAVRGDLLERLGRGDEARRELERAAALTRNRRERDVLLARAAACTPAPTRS